MPKSAHNGEIKTKAGIMNTNGIPNLNQLGIGYPIWNKNNTVTKMSIVKESAKIKLQNGLPKLPDGFPYALKVISHRL